MTLFASGKDAAKEKWDGARYLFFFSSVAQTHASYYDIKDKSPLCKISFQR